MKPVYVESPWDTLKCPRCGRLTSVTSQEWEMKIVKCRYCPKPFRITNVQTNECLKCEEYKAKWIKTRQRLQIANKACAIRAIGWKLSRQEVTKLRAKIEELEAEKAHLRNAKVRGGGTPSSVPLGSALRGVKISHEYGFLCFRTETGWLLWSSKLEDMSDSGESMESIINQFSLPNAEVTDEAKRNSVH